MCISLKWLIVLMFDTWHDILVSREKNIVLMGQLHPYFPPTIYWCISVLDGVDICKVGTWESRSCLDWVLISKLAKSKSDSQENLVLTIEKSQSCLDATFQSQKSQWRSIFIKIYQKSQFFLDLDWFWLLRPPSIFVSTRLRRYGIRLSPGYSVNLKIGFY